jgi:hypothetical protein
MNNNNPYSNLVSLVDHNHLESTIRALYIPQSGEITVLRQSYESIVSYVFSDSTSLPRVILNSNSHFLVDVSNAYYENRINVIASKLYRSHTFVYNKYIYGDTVLFGSSDLFTGKDDLTHYSVPYELIEQVTLLSKQ